MAIGIVRNVRSAFGSPRHLEVVLSKILLSDRSFAAKLAESSPALIDTARRSRIIATLASGMNSDRLRANSAHRNWYLHEVDNLIELGLLEQGTHKNTPLCDALISSISADGGFIYKL